MTTLDFTGVVVCFNEAKHLRQCLERLKFCRELVVVDLGSTDNSAAIAKEMGARVVAHEWVPVVEKVRAFAAEQAKTDWIVFMDPDMMFPEGLLGKVEDLIRNNPTLGMIGVPYQNHFAGKPLWHGRWGGVYPGYPAVMQRHRVNLGDNVHRGITLKPGFIALHAGWKKPRIVIVHYWADSFEYLLAKNERYVREEGKSRYENGHRTSLLKALWATGYAYFRSMVVRLGFLDGAVGVRLCYVAARYQWQAHQSLLRYQKQQKQK